MGLDYRDLGAGGTERRIQKLKELHENANLGGGPESIAKQHERKKFTARERLALLLDEDSFQEFGKFVSSESCPVPGDGVITGFGTIHGKRVGVVSQDFTVMGGSLGRKHADKICKIQETCTRSGIPLIGINDSGGARIQEGVVSLGGYADIFYRNVQASGVVPQISAIMGPCAGGAVYSPALTDFVFMVRDTSFMFLTGPDVIKEVLNEDVTFEELGGALTHNQKSGVAHFQAKNELECLEQIKRLMGYLPSNNMEDPPFHDIGDDRGRREEKLASIIPDDPNKPYDMRELISLVVDRNSFFEVQPLFAPNIVIGFARFGGHVAGIVANQPRDLAGCLDINSSMKGARFIRFCDAFNIPIVTFQDVPGFLPGVNQEWLGVIKHGAKLLYAYCEASVPKLCVTTRKSYGGAYCVMSSRQVGGDWNVAWPTAEVAVMGSKGAVKITRRKELKGLPKELAKAHAAFGEALNGRLAAEEAYETLNEQVKQLAYDLQSADEDAQDEMKARLKADDKELAKLKKAYDKALKEEEKAQAQVEKVSSGLAGLAKPMEDEYKAELLHPYLASEVGYIDEVIDPRDTRPKLISGLELLKNKVISRPRRKHGNIPL